MLSPNDIFQSAVNRIYSQLQPYGYKLLKNNDIKKKTDKFTARIFFFRNTRNYILKGGNKGSVETEIHCIINTKSCEGAYRLSFGKGSVDWFELYDKEKGLNTQIVDDVYKIIKKEFADVVAGLERDAYAQLSKMNLMPQVSSDDFSYTCTIKHQFLEAFNFLDILEKFEKNCEIFYRPDIKAKRGQDRYFETVRNQLDYNFIENRIC